MVFIRHAAAPASRAALRCVRRQPAAVLPASRSLSVTARRQGGHGPSFDPPGGWLWGVKPGEKTEPEGWEWPMYVFCGSLIATAIALAFKPDTT